VIRNHRGRSKVVNLLVLTGNVNIINVNDYSTLKKLLRITAQVLRFIRMLKSKSTTEREITSHDIALAQLHLIRQSQTIPLQRAPTSSFGLNSLDSSRTKMISGGVEGG